MSKALYPHPSDKPSETLHLPINAVYQTDNDAVGDNDYNDLDNSAYDTPSEEKECDPLSYSSEIIPPAAHVPLEIQASYLDGELAENLLHKHLKSVAAKSGFVKSGGAWRAA